MECDEGDMKLKVRHGLSLRYTVFVFTVMCVTFFATVQHAIISSAATVLEAPTQLLPQGGSVVKGAYYTKSWTTVSSAIKYEYASYHDSEATSLKFSAQYTSATRSASGIPDITYWWRVRAIDASGNKSSWSELVKLTIDNTKPVITGSTATQNPSTTTVTITGSVTEPHLESVSLKLDGTDVDSSAVTLTGNDFTAELQNLSIGNHTVEITATDKAGNKSAVKSHMFTVTDTIAPVITITSPTTFVEGEDVVITGTATDNHSTVGEVSVLVDGVEKGPTTATNGKFSLNLGKLAPGQYRVIATGTDEAGNRGASIPATITVTQKPAPEPEPTPPIDEPNTTPTDPQPQSTQTQPNPTRIVYLQPTTNTAQTTDSQDSEPVVETDDSKDQNALSARTQDIRGTRDSEDTTPTLLGMAWYYWLPIIAAIIFPWIIIAAKKQQKDGEE